MLAPPKGVLACPKVVCGEELPPVAAAVLCVGVPQGLAFASPMPPTAPNAAPPPGVDVAPKDVLPNAGAAGAAEDEAGGAPHGDGVLAKEVEVAPKEGFPNAEVVAAGEEVAPNDGCPNVEVVAAGEDVAPKEGFPNAGVVAAGEDVVPKDDCPNAEVVGVDDAAALPQGEAFAPESADELPKAGCVVVEAGADVGPELAESGPAAAPRSSARGPPATVRSGKTLFCLTASLETMYHVLNIPSLLSTYSAGNGTALSSTISSLGIGFLHNSLTLRSSAMPMAEVSLRPSRTLIGRPARRVSSGMVVVKTFV